MAYGDFFIESYKQRLISLLDYYFILGDSNYQPTERHRLIPDKMIHRAYSDFFDVINSDYEEYSVEEKRCALKNDMRYWDKCCLLYTSWKMLRVTIYELGHDYANAIKAYDDLEKEYGTSRNIYYYRADCYNEIGDTERAVVDMTKFIELGDGKDYFAIVRRADYYREGGKYEEAIADFTKGIELEPVDAYAYYKRGWCYELTGDDDSAMKDYNAGIDVDKSYPYIFLMRGELYLKRGEKEKANADFEEIIRQDTVAESGSCRQYRCV